MVLEKLGEVCPDRKLFGLHSWRAGGASDAASAGVHINTMEGGAVKMPKTAMHVRFTGKQEQVVSITEN